MDKIRFISLFTEQIRNNTAAIFAGAGFSKPAGFVDWPTLLNDVADEIGLEANREAENLPALAQYYVNETNNRQRLSELILNQFSDSKTIDENHQLLAQLPIHTYWTTNYDHLIEESLSNEKKKPHVIINESDLSISKYGSDVTVYKMHGDVDSPYKTILTLDEYESYSERHPLMLNALYRDLTNLTFMFVGFSFTDPNLKQILSTLRVLSARNKGIMKRHYCLMRKPVKENNESDAEFVYRERKFKFYCRDLIRFGIEIIELDDFAEIAQIIKDIHDSYYKNTIFISGAITDCSGFNKDDIQKFTYQLSGQLIKNGYRIVSGYGLGIGNDVIGGVLSEVYDKGSQFNDELIVRPFPQGNQTIKAKWESYRRDMIAYSGISLFIFGNKKNDKGETINSNGMLQEYEISEKNGNILIPVASTNWMSRKLWDKLQNDHMNKSPYKECKDDFAKIADSQAFNDINQLTTDIVNLIKKLTKDA
jgi:hypothetical protein